MSFYRGTIVRLTVVLIIVIVIVYDLGVIATGYYEIDNHAMQVANQAAARYHATRSRSQALAEAQAAARDAGVFLSGFDVRQDEARVNVQSVPSGSLVAYRITSLRRYLVAESYYAASTR